jgi:chromosome segregation ATPase
VAQQVEILSLNIDTQQLIQRLQQTKNEIERLQASQRSLSQAGQGNTEQFIRQGAEISNLQRQYRSQNNVLNQLTAANNQAATATQAVTTALNRNITTIAEATENNRQLTVVRNQLNLANNEGQQALARINQRINDNTEFIRSNLSALEQQRMNIGAYSQSIQNALQNLNPFNGGLATFQQNAQNAGGTSQYLRQNFAQLGQGIAGVTRQALTFIATPIGATIAGVTALFAGAKAIFDYNKGLV